MKYSYVIFAVFLLLLWQSKLSAQRCKIYESCTRDRECTGCRYPVACIQAFVCKLCLPRQLRPF